MKNRLIAIVSCVALLVMSLPGTALAAKTEVSDCIGFMNAMGFITEDEIGGEKIDKGITRMDFALFTARIMGINESETSETNYYRDIPEDHWGKFSINSLAESGILSGTGGDFRPDDTIKKAEAARITVACIGRGAEAEALGGYPNGYLSVASREKLFGDGVGDELTYRDAAVLLYNTINTELLQAAIKGDTAEYAKRGETLLSMYNDVYPAKGLVNAVYGISVDENSAVKENDVVIDGEHYTSDTWLYDFLGMKIEFYYKDDDGAKTIVYVMKHVEKNNEVTNITSDEYDKYSDGGVYYTDDTDRSKRVKIYDGAAVIRNGKNVSDDMENAFADFYGCMRIIDTGRFDAADIVIIEDYKDIAVGQIDKDDRIIYDRYDSMVYMDLSEENDEIIRYIDGEGNKTSFEAIVKDSVVSVAMPEDRSFAIVRMGGKAVTGAISAKGIADNEPYIAIDGVEYEANEDFYNAKQSDFVIGQSGTFQMDFLGKIAHFVADKSGKMVLGFLINAYIDSEIDDKILDSERVIMKIFTEDGEIVKLPSAKKVKIDGISYNKIDNVLDAISNGDEVTSQMIRYRYDSVGDIREIDTQANNISEGKYALKRLDTDKRPYKQWTGFIGPKAYVTDGTKTFVVPPEGQEKTADPSMYMIKTASYIPGESNQRIDLFYTDPESLSMDFLVYYRGQDTSIGTYATMYVVEEISSGMNNDEQEATAFTLDSSGSDITYFVAPDYEGQPGGNKNVPPSKIGVGDIIRIKTDYKNEICNIELILDYDKAEADGDARFFENSVSSDYKIENGAIKGNFMNGFKITYGYVARVDGNYLMWGYDKPGDEDELYNVTIQSSQAKIMVVDMENRHDKCQSGSISDIVGYYQSSVNYSKVISIAQNAIIKQMFVYK